MKACACRSMLRARPFGLVCCARSGNGWLTPLAGPTEGRRLASCHKSRSRRRGSPTSRLGVGHFDGDAAVLFSLIAVCVCVCNRVWRCGGEPRNQPRKLRDDCSRQRRYPATNSLSSISLRTLVLSNPPSNFLHLFWVSRSCETRRGQYWDCLWRRAS